MRLRRQNDFRTFAEKRRRRASLFRRTPKNFPLPAAARVVLAVPCLPQTGLPFRVFRVLRGQKAAGNEPLKNGNGATARRSSIC